MEFLVDFTIVVPEGTADAELQQRMSAESERISRQTEQHLQKIQDQSTQEIVLIARAARHELRRYSAQLALGFAEQRLRSRMMR